MWLKDLNSLIKKDINFSALIELDFLDLEFKPERLSRLRCRAHKQIKPFF